MKKYNTVELELIKVTDVVSTSESVESEKIFFGDSEGVQMRSLSSAPSDGLFGL